ncbi:MAG: amidohydrolase [Nostocoides sp.]
MTNPSLVDDALASSLCLALDSMEAELVQVRRDLHAHPELSFHEVRSTALIRARLEQAGVAVTPLPGTGLTADIGAEQPAFRVALRADIDALPVRERTGSPFASTVAGVCHACGHDVHTAAVLGAGLALHQHEAALRERGLAVRLIFQAAEEILPGGAQVAVEAGAVHGVDVAYAVHCDPSLDVGKVGLREGPLTAATDSVTVRLEGRGGHTSRPHLTQDLTFALAKVVTEVPAALSRRVDPRSGAALVWGAINAGKVPNVIPSTGECAGTLRILDADAWQTIGPLIEEIVAAVVTPYAVRAEVLVTKGVPPVVNGAEPIEVLRSAAAVAKLGATSTSQSLGGEDFAWYLREVPGAMARLGTRAPGGHTFDLHQGNLVIDEAAIGHAARLLAVAAVTRVKADEG